jgi:heme-degrading monooxygenase HmoA
MHARVISGLIRPGKREEAISLFQNNVVPRAKEQEGFKGIFLLADEETNKFYSITLWETEDFLSASEKSMYLVKQLGSVASHFAMPPMTERFEVVIKA